MGVRFHRDERAKFLCRAETAQRLQSCDRLRGRGMAAHAGRQPDFPFFEIPNWAVRLVVSAPDPRISSCADHCVGVRANARRNQARGGCG